MLLLAVQKHRLADPHPLQVPRARLASVGTSGLRLRGRRVFVIAHPRDELVGRQEVLADGVVLGVDVPVDHLQGDSGGATGQ